MRRAEAGAAAPARTGRTAAAADLMTRFAERTEIGSAASARRYLWTDAFAVCNFLALDRLTGEGRFGELALQLVDRVHHALGRHRADGERSGWLSGAGDAAGEAHPTGGGLRIGKPLPERRPDEPLDERLEWDRDGQYFHYLVKWMHALDQVARATGQPMFNTWARELAEVAHRAFTVTGGGGRRRMIWKASVDLSRPLVASMGQHDPLDGWVTCLELDATARSLGASGPDLRVAAADFASMIDAAGLATGDPLGTGGLLADACRLEQLARRDPAAGDRVPALLDSALVGLRHASRELERRTPAERRLAFRELGLAIGLAAADLALQVGASAGTAARWREVAAFDGLRGAIEAFWLDPAHRRSASWVNHQDINDVMLATCLVPEGFLALDGA